MKAGMPDQVDLGVVRSRAPAFLLFFSRFFLFRLFRGGLCTANELGKNRKIEQTN